MTQIKHHLTDQLMMGYAAGALPEAFNLVVATHLSMCDSCRAAAQAYDAIGGAILETETRVSVADDALAETLALIAQGPSVPKPLTNSDVSAPLAAYIGGSLRDVKWRSVGMGVRQAVLSTSKLATARLLYIPAGAAVPDHGHRGTELTLVLQGAFRDATARFAEGDVEVANEDLNHTPVAEIGKDCICLAATDAPLRFNSWIPRIAQPFLRI
ncbi:MAG TPA: transcriptional regulator [Rhodobacteraceae bacterium]|nr:transcriptional regulator [Paracoccaceae bacterium]